MSNQLGPLEVICDAPPYPIVQASRSIGLDAPEDVRWMKLSNHQELNDEAADTEDRSVWQKILHPVPTQAQRCICREKLPKLSKYRFTYSSGDEVTYSVGQCPKCKTVFWEDG